MKERKKVEKQKTKKREKGKIKTYARLLLNNYKLSYNL